MKKKVAALTAVVAVLAILCVVLCACAPKDAQKGQKKLEKKGYDVEYLSNDDVLEGFGDIIDIETNGGIAASKGKNFVLAIWFDDEESAEEFASSIDVFSKTIAEEMGAKLEDCEIGHKKELFYFGTEKAVKDLLKSGIVLYVTSADLEEEKAEENGNKLRF